MSFHGQGLSALEGGAGSPRHAEGGDDQRSDKAPLEREYRPGELAPYWGSAYPPAKLTSEEEATMKSLCDLVGNKDIAARRWEVEQSWEARLFDRGYQYLLPRKGGGFILPPFATDYNKGAGKRGGMKWYGYETNIYETYGEIITAALTRDIPRVRFSPMNPNSDDDLTAADAANRFARVFASNNDLIEMHHQMVYYLRTDGRAMVAVDYLIDAQRWGYEEGLSEELAPETASTEQPELYLVRHGETALNREDKVRSQSSVPLDEMGQRDMERAISFLRDKGVEVIFASPVPRSMESAGILGRALGVRVEPDDRLAALDLGDNAGKDQSSVDLTRYRENPEEPIPGGESFDNFEARVRDAIFSILASGVRAAVVTHDSVISTAVKVLEGVATPVTNLMVTGGVAGVFGSSDTGFFVRSLFPANIPLGRRGEPRGQEHAEVFGKLEAKVPINAQVLRDCPFVQISREYDYAQARAMFPDKADAIRPGSAGAGENELDRIARINAALALEASYVTGDSMVRDCTVQRTWFRPGFFMEISDKKMRASLLEKFPDGCLVVFAGEAFIFARNESMDDHLTLVQAYPGSGMNRLALCSKLLSLQKRVNNWIDLLNDFFIRTIPQRFINQETFDVEALNDQSSVPGVYVPYIPLTAGQDVSKDIWVEPSPTHQPSLPEFVMYFLEKLPQLISGALPTLFGSESNTDTVGGAVIQRDQALGRLGTPWHNISVATANYFRQAVRLAAMCRRDGISSMPDGEAVRIDLADMKGNILCYPESNANFPESWVQKQSRYQQLLMDVSNPLVAQILADPSNQRLARDMVGIPEFNIPAADSYEKQEGEIELLLKGRPMPNSAKVEAVDQALQLAQQLQQESASGISVSPERMALAQQALEAAKDLPDEVSSVPIDHFVDNHVVEMRACLDWLNKPQGRRMKTGTPEDRQEYENVRLHMLEHRQCVMAASGQGAPQKPPSVSMNLRDMPPDAAAAALQHEGLPTSPQDIQKKRTDDVEMKRAAKTPAQEG